jgi:hypothetical protein
VALVAGPGCDASPGGEGGVDGARADAATPGGGEDLIFDPEQFHHFEVELADADWEWLQANAVLEEYRPATVRFQGRTYQDAALRYKGDYGTLETCVDGGTQVCPKLSFKISFNEYGLGRFYGLRKILLHSSVRDPSIMREFTAYHLYGAMGLPAPRASHAQLTVNGEWLGLFVLVEYVDEEFVSDRWAAGSGNLYKSVWPRYPDPAEYVAALRTNEQSPDVTRMIDLHAAIATASDATFAADVAPFLDLSQLAVYLAVDRAVSHNDGVSTFYCYGSPTAPCANGNYYWYDEPGGHLALIPWDTDYTLYDVNRDLGRSLNDPSPAGCAAIPYCEYFDEQDCGEHDIWLSPPQCDPLLGPLHRTTWDDTRAALADLLAGPLSATALRPLLEGERTKIRAAVVADETGPGLVEFEAANQELDEILAEQRVEIDRLLAE